MKSPQRPPVLANALIRFFSGPELENSIIGDLQEQFANAPKAKLWYWRQTLFSIPSLLSMHIQSLGRRTFLNELLFCFAGLFIVLIWEIGIARELSWPIARLILDYSPLTTGNTCRAVYIALYSSFSLILCLGLSGFSKRLGRSEHFRVVHAILLAIIVSIPVFYLSIFPLPTDGSVLFRASQLGTVWCVLLLPFLTPQIINHFSNNKREII